MNFELQHNLYIFEFFTKFINIFTLMFVKLNCDDKFLILSN